MQERKNLLEGVTDPLYKQFSALDARGAGQIEAGDLIMAGGVGTKVADRLLREMARDENSDYVTFQDFARFLRGG